jgi:membrane-associated protein
VTFPPLAGAAVPALGPSFLDPEHLIAIFGPYALIGIVVIVFVETGLLFPFLPGDSLLFTAGMLVARDEITIPLWVLCAILSTTAFAGDQNAFWIGRRTGPRLFSRPDSRFFKQKYLDQTTAFYARHGGKTIIIGRFVPFVRTYAAVAAGAGSMTYRRFAAHDAVGALLWGSGVTVLGYLLGNIGFVKDNIELMLVAVVAVSVVPIGIEMLRRRAAAGRAAAKELLPELSATDG